MKLNIKVPMMLAMLAASTAHAGVIITDGNVSLGVNDLGQLNVNGGVADVGGETGVGVRWLDAGLQYESTAQGCACEGWGVSANGVSGYANNSKGIAGLSSVNFSSTATTATSVVNMADDLTITHDFSLSASDNLYRVSVTIENTSGVDIADLLYRRTMDWDTAPTPFSEFVTIGGTAGASSVIGATDDGFCSSNPLVSCGTRVTGASGDFIGSGADDHGANFDFNFGELAIGESYSFDIFYGGAANKDDAFSALGAVGAEVYSFGWSGIDADQDGFEDDVVDPRITPTYIFGFSGVGGASLPPTDIPEPASVALFALALMGLASRRKLSK
jgi:type IV pilus assembly protein PilY1